MSSRRSSIVGAAIVTVIATAVVTGCGDDSVESDAELFCGEAQAQRETLLAPPMATEEQLTASLDLYRRMGQLAPVAISEQWSDLVVAMETASTLVPGDADSEQRVAAQAFAMERSAYEISVWLKRNCGVDFPVVTITAQAPPPPPTTTIASSLAPSLPATTPPASG